MKPPLIYFGGKTRLAPRIAALLPEHVHYVEPYGGSLAVLLAKRPSKFETVNDLDGDLMTFWRVLRDQPAELARACALTPHARAEHETAREPIPADLPDVERARLVWVQLTQGRSAVRSKTGWRTYVDPAGSNTSMPGYLDGYVDRMAAAAERLHNVALECRPALDLVRTYGAVPEVCLYVDPPYLGSTRRGGRYKHEMAEDVEHVALAEELHRCRASVLLSGYPSPLYDNLFGDWDRLEIPHFTGQGGRRDAGRRIEVLWSNRPLSDLRLFHLGEGLG